MWKTVPVAVPESRVNPQFPALDYEYVLMEPVSARPPPLLVYIHGGPHSCCVAEFQAHTAGLCVCGYAVLMVNYRGSVGFGQHSVDSLPGNIGRQDVHDVQAVAEQVAASGAVDARRVVVMGGSHGGFLTLHCIAQSGRRFYRAAVARNPVVDVASMLGATDIPDWAYVESGMEFDARAVPTAEVYADMLKRSPLSGVDGIETPLLLLVGGQDRRVPASQGLQLGRALEARNLPLRVLWYPDCSHPLSDVRAEADGFINVVKWFDEHII